MKVVVVGAGAVGGYFGSRLAEAGVDVTFLVREKRAAQLRERGLTVRSVHGDYWYTPQVVTDAAEVEACDVLVVAVKNYHLADTLSTLKPLVERGAKVLPLLNGVGHLDLLRAEFGEAAVLGGYCNIIVTLNEQGDAVHTSPTHEFTFGALVPEQEAVCERLLAAGQGANINLHHSQAIYRDMWQKYLFITAFSGVTTASRLSIDGVMAHPPTREVLRRALTEMHTLAGCKGAVMPDDLVEKLMTYMDGFPAGATSSMHQDFRKGLPLEVESLQGVAVRYAKEEGIDLPTVRTLYGLLVPHATPVS